MSEQVTQNEIVPSDAGVADIATRSSMQSGNVYDSLAHADTNATGTIAVDESNVAAETRASLGWGKHYSPPVPQANGRREYYRICDALHEELAEINTLSEEMGEDEMASPIAEIQEHLEELYDCDFGKGESLKRLVTGIQSQINNAHWTERHVRFLNDAVAYLRGRYLLDSADVEAIDDMIEENNLDVFRGTVTETEAAIRYKIVEDVD